MNSPIDKYYLLHSKKHVPCHPYMFVAENYSSKFTIMSFWAPAPKSPAENDIPKKTLGYVTAKNNHIFDSIDRNLY